MAQATEFGWVISGPATRSRPSNGLPSVNVTHLQPDPPPLHQLLYEFWDGEETPGDEEPTLEEQAEKHYYANFLPNACIRSLPLGDSRNQAVFRTRGQSPGEISGNPSSKW